MKKKNKVKNPRNVKKNIKKLDLEKPSLELEKQTLSRKETLDKLKLSSQKLFEINRNASKYIAQNKINYWKIFVSTLGFVTIILLITLVSSFSVFSIPKSKISFWVEQESDFFVKKAVVSFTKQIYKNLENQEDLVEEDFMNTIQSQSKDISSYIASSGISPENIDLKVTALNTELKEFSIQIEKPVIENLTQKIGTSFENLGEKNFISAKLKFDLRLIEAYKNENKINQIIIGLDQFGNFVDQKIEYDKQEQRVFCNNLETELLQTTKTRIMELTKSLGKAVSEEFLFEQHCDSLFLNQPLYLDSNLDSNQKEELLEIPTVETKKTIKLRLYSTVTYTT